MAAPIKDRSQRGKALRYARKAFEAAMIGQTISHYKVIEKLGEGGMGVVYRAMDLNLNRVVALKILPGEQQTEEDRRRFIQEARAASLLDHPNVCTIFEAGETEGRFFIAMACYDGETLRQRLARGPLSVDEALAIAEQIARGLERAHEAGIVHRDIKPANIMITARGAVKILDFGLARMSSESRITKPQTTLGTPAYMSPEQVRGETVDLHSDIWSLGVVLFEMLTARLPFGGENAHSMIFAILYRDPPRLTQAGSAHLDHVIARTLQKNPADRYHSLGAMIDDLRAPSIASGSPAARAMSDLPTERRIDPARSKPSIGVLPFADMSPQRDQEYFCDGIAEELINALSKLQKLRVASRTSSFQFKGTSPDIRTVAERLNVSTVLEGSVRKAGERIRVSAQLINARDGFPLWSDRFDRDLSDIFAIQEEIAESIVNALQVTLSEQERHLIEKPVADVRAYEFYLRGRSFFYRFRRKDFEFAREMFARAIEIDPGYALGYAGLADISSLLYMFWEGTQENLRQAEEASSKAMELDPNLAEALVSRGLATSLRREFDKATEDFEAAIRLDPRSFEAYYFYARMCLVRGELKKSADLFEQAFRVRPDDYQSPLLAGPIYIALGDAARAERAFREGLHLAEQQLAIHPDDARAYYLGAAGWTELGERDKSREWIAKALAIDFDDPAVLFNVACRYARLGDRGPALDALERAVGHGYAYREWIENDPDLNDIRDEPRYRAVIESLS